MPSVGAKDMPDRAGSLADGFLPQLFARGNATNRLNALALRKNPFPGRTGRDPENAKSTSYFGAALR
jgi:hypothetical protein